MYVIYETGTGRITQVTVQHGAVPTEVPDGLGVLELAPDAGSLQQSFWVSGGRLLPRAAMDLPAHLALAVGEVATLHAPPGAVAHVQGAAVPLADGVLEVEGRTPTIYHIEIQAPGFLDHTVEVVVGGEG